MVERMMILCPATDKCGIILCNGRIHDNASSAMKLGKAFKIKKQLMEDTSQRQKSGF